MRNKIKIIVLAACALLFVFSMAMAGCAGKNGDAAWYLSLRSEEWKTYTEEDEIPAGVRFAADGEVFVLETTFAAGEQFTVNKLGSAETLGFSALFSAESSLTEGENGSLNVAEGGTYVLRLDASTGTLTYTFTPEAEARTVRSVEISAPATALYVGSQYTFTALVTYSDGTTDGEVSWSSSAPEVVSVDGNGGVQVLAVGKAVITAQAGELSDSVAVTAEQPTVAVTGVTLDRDTLSLELNANETLTASVLPENASNRTVLWTSDDTDVVTVTRQGEVTAVGYGSTDVTVTTASGGFAAKCRVTVVRHAETISLGSDTLSLVAQGQAKTLSVTVGPDSVTDPSFTYEVVSGAGLISVKKTDGGLLIAGRAEGSASVVVSSVDNSSLQATCSVTVHAADTVVADMQNNVQITLGESATLTPSLDGAEIASIAWSKDTNAITLTSSDTSATVTATAFGTATVTAAITDTDSQTYNLTCNVLVAEEYYFIYGTGVGASDWDYQDYVSDADAAAEAEVLMSAESRGVYTLTRHLTPSMGFQIIFPNVANDWNKAFKADGGYYDASRSDTAYVANTTDKFAVNTAGTYTITLDLTGGSAKIYIKAVALDVTGVQLTADKTVLAYEDTAQLTISVNPTAASFAEGNVWLTSDAEGFEEYVQLTYDLETMTATVTVTGEPQTGFALTVHCSLDGIEGWTQISVLSADEQETPVRSIAFAKDAYAIDVNNGGAAWTATVSASVNAEATSQGVTYSATDSGITVDPSTGVVTATAFGTFTVTATADGDSNYTDTCTVTVYSSAFYLNGVVYGTLNWNDPLGQTITTLSGTVFEDFAFTDSGDHKEFTLETPLNVDDSFQIVFLGMDGNWTNAITSSAFNASASDNSSEFKNDVKVSAKGIYVIVIDLSGTAPSFTVNYKEAILSSVTLSADGSLTVSTGDSLTVSAALDPDSIVPAADEVQWTLADGSDTYVTVAADADNALYATVEVIGVPETGSVTVEVICTVKGVSARLQITVMAEGSQVVAPASIAFAQDAYAINVNNGGAAWTATVSASVNDEATNQSVTYSTSDSGITVDASTGVVAATALGTFRITAASVADPSLTATCTVTVYSDSFYIIGDLAGSDTALEQTATTTVETAFENYTLTASEDNKTFTVTMEITAWTNFQIVFCGMDSNWTGAVTAYQVDTAHSSASVRLYLEYDNKNIQVSSTSTYTVTVDLSGTAPVVTITETV